MLFTSKSLSETEKIAQDFLSKIYSHKISQKTAVVVALSGDLGSGKTTFTQSVAKILRVEETVTSPTFVIEKIYELTNQKFKHLIHIDAYRIEKSDELLHLGWNEIVSDPGNLILIEWPERVADIIPKNALKIFFAFVDENTRIIEM